MVADGAAKPTLRIGIVGLGVASTAMLPEVAAHPNVRITAGADVRQQALDRFASKFGGETYHSMEDLCKSPNVDAVYIFTPNRFHAEHAIIAAEHGKQVTADKPMALTLGDCDAIIDAAERHGVRLLVGHTQSLDAPILKMAEIVRSGDLGAPVMINTWFYSDWLYRPRSEQELDAAQGEGLVLRQGPVQVDIVRMVGGGLVRSVRAMTSTLDKARPIEGTHSAFLEFENGAAATLVYNGYAHFDSTELTYGLGLRGRPQDADTHLRSRRQIHGFSRPEDEWAHKDATRYGGPRSGGGVIGGPGERRHAFFGITVVSCEKGDIRQSPEGLVIYGDEERLNVVAAQVCADGRALARLRWPYICAFRRQGKEERLAFGPRSSAW